MATTTGDGTALAQAREENARLRKELETLLHAQDVAKDRARIAIENLVSENKKLVTEIYSIETKSAEMRRERVELLNQLRK
ncbi:uncharacterized protein ACA1_150560 [Acanthamoeba castellanii str. Neff]|uniref:Uncharacterized protein n=1 Tax=Acanthamoeba castellanii (strain ATCC 30010 / Neff) TaxID=1257118 RepID=L8GZV2_ACACF|nr:uncharacterized protein ACA1_150560 [Acanthamoeba castellanii str. Neff]ELR18794.1 hypothetical protein ACA1_150560 [Acanthamoeba castellanii str. Neff]